MNLHRRWGCTQPNGLLRLQHAINDGDLLKFIA